MKRKNTTRNALVTSIISMLLCVSMLVGTTFAWFTDEVVSGTNTIAAGNLDVELYYSKTKDFSDEKKVDNATLLFTDKDGNEIKHWEPGVVAYTNLQVANVGTLALTYRMSLAFGNMNYVEYPDGSVYDLSDVLQVAIVEGGFEGDRAAAHALTNYGELESFHLEGVLEGNTTTETFGVVIYWRPGTNEYDNLFNMNNGKTTSDGEPLRVDLGINLFATQEEYEKDSFDDLYDEAADNTINAGEVVRYDDPAQNITESFQNNGTLIVEGGAWTNDGRVLTNNGEATITDVDVTGGNAGTYALVSEGADSVLTLDEVVLVSGGGAIGAVDGATVIVNSGEYKVDSASTSGRYLIYTDGAGSTVIVNGGTFSWDKNDNQKRAYVYANTDTTVIINGGTFGKASTRSGYTDGILGAGEVIIKGGTFGFNPTKWVPLGYQAVKEGDTWTVSAIPPVEDNTALKDAIAAGETEIVLGSGEYSLPSLADKDGVTIVGAPDGSTVIGGESAATGFASNFGKNTTIANVTFSGSENGVRWSYAKGGTSTFDNCTFAGDSVYGFHIDSSNGATFIFNDCTFSGFNAFAGDLVKVVFNNCTFLHNGNYGHTNIWSTAEFNNCTFGDKASVGIRGTNAHMFFNGVEESYHHEYIGSAESLFAFADSVNNGGDNWNGQKVLLVADIDLENAAWAPIGQTGATTFNGSFDGQGHTISNLKIDSAAQTGKHYSSGLFGWIEIHSTEYRVIENVKVVNATVTGNHNCGVIVGYGTGSIEIKNCEVKNATVTCNVANDDANGDKAGVIIGNLTAEPQSKVVGCSAVDCTVTAGRDAGQLVGAGNAENVTGTATNVTVTANGQGTGANINNALVGRDL